VKLQNFDPKAARKSWSITVKKVVHIRLFCVPSFYASPYVLGTKIRREGEWKEREALGTKKCRRAFDRS